MIETFYRIYARIFSKPVLRKLNNLMLNAALRARGYTNHQSLKVSGELFFVEKILAPSNPRLCIDVGANIGGYTTELLEKTNAKVVSFEPLPPAFEQLSTAVSRYGDRVTLENKGVGDEETTLAIKYNPEALVHASFSEDVNAKVDYVSNEMTANVPVVTLDGYCARNAIEAVDFIKIDTEGFESEVFRGATETFRNLRPKFVQIEFNWHQMFRNTSLNYFAEFLPGYEVYQLIPSGWVKRDPRHPLSNIFLFSNFVFVRP